MTSPTIWPARRVGERAEGSGDYPEQAVMLLAAELRRIRKGGHKAP